MQGPLHSSGGPSVLRKTCLLFTFFFLEGEFLLFHLWWEESNKEEIPKGNLSFQI